MRASRAGSVPHNSARYRSSSEVAPSGTRCTGAFMATRLRAPTLSAETTTVPTASASQTAWPQLSARDMLTYTWLALSSSSTLDRATHPWKRMASLPGSDRTRCRRSCPAGPSPRISRVMRNPDAARRATTSATESTALRWMRYPAVTTLSPSVGRCRTTGSAPGSRTGGGITRIRSLATPCASTIAPTRSLITTTRQAPRSVSAEIRRRGVATAGPANRARAVDALWDTPPPLPVRPTGGSSAPAHSSGDCTGPSTNGRPRRVAIRLRTL